MNRLKIFLANVLILFLAFSCNNNFEQVKRNHYFKYKKIFPKELTRHFPDKLPDGNIGGYARHGTILADSCFSPDEFIISIKYGLIEYDTIKHSFQHYKCKITPSDTNILLLFSYCDVIVIDGDIYRNQETEKKKALAEKNRKKVNGIPIPIFELDDLNKTGNLYNLDDDYTLYVLDAQPGIFIDEKYLADCTCLPKNWKHGFSRGVAMNDNKHTIVYWLVIW